MSKIDIKNYLEKIYKIPVLNVRTKVMAGGDIKHPTRGHVMAKEDDYKVAFVQLGDGVTFEFPEIFKEIKSPAEKQVAEIKQLNRADMENEQKYWDKLSVPVWFR
ncbi:hypothetical protein C0Q70_10595 [Pomacea canaliculata]|uniref:Large ribosomal subunit protein uL23m n=2 Tax=Pomacea canaliculata TaxID=400727 RepID=A0A2T7P3L0_POMCA|nr:hypothetical protein C0Q70_10595 [Pomacea canaliculata]